MGDRTIQEASTVGLMFHRAIDLSFREGTTIELTFQDGDVKAYDMSQLFERYPQLEALKDRSLFCSGKLEGFYGVIWNDDLDIGAETVYENGVLVRKVRPAPHVEIGEEVHFARACEDMSQVQLASLTGIDQSDISKIERGVANPSVGTLKRIAQALGYELHVTFEKEDKP